MDAVFANVKSAWGSLDFLLHAIAFSDKEQLDGRYVDTTEDNFIKTMVVSCYSFTALAQRAEKLMTNGGSLLTMTYYGAEKWMPHYNVMGLAKAALESAVRYFAVALAGRGITVNAVSPCFVEDSVLNTLPPEVQDYIRRWHQRGWTPMGRLGTPADVGNAVRLLCSEDAGFITGQTITVDGGASLMNVEVPTEIQLG